MLQHVFFSEIMSECCTNSALIPCHTFEIFAFKSDHINHLTDLSKLTTLNIIFQLPHSALMVGQKQCWRKVSNKIVVNSMFWPTVRKRDSYHDVGTTLHLFRFHLIWSPHQNCTKCKTYSQLWVPCVRKSELLWKQKYIVTNHVS